MNNRLVQNVFSIENLTNNYFCQLSQNITLKSEITRQIYAINQRGLWTRMM